MLGNETSSPCAEGRHPDDDQAAVEVISPPTKIRHHDFHVVPVQPLKPLPRFVLVVTELPALILWAYATYWLEICAMSAMTAQPNVWYSACVASLFVGVGLNANAYRALRCPLSRTRKKAQERKRGRTGGGSWLQNWLQQTRSLEFTPSPRWSKPREGPASPLSWDTLPPQPEPFTDGISGAKGTLNVTRWGLMSHEFSLPLCWSENDTKIDYG